ncbi:MAG: NUDIX domain-containing protein, partial [Cyanobacteria bacterium J06598_3]
VVDGIAWICIKEKRLLCARSHGKEVFYLPGGKREVGETDWSGLHREVKEEVGVILIEETLKAMITIEEIAHGYAQPTQVMMKCFQAEYTGTLAAAAEIEQLAWLQHVDKAQCAPATQGVIEHLKKQRLID